MDSIDRWLLKDQEKRAEILSRAKTLTDGALAYRFGMTRDMVRLIRTGYIPSRFEVPAGLYEALAWRRANDRERARFTSRAIAKRRGLTYEQYRRRCRKLADKEN